MDKSKEGYLAAIKRVKDGSTSTDDIDRAKKEAHNTGEAGRLAREALDKRRIDYRS